MTPIEPTPATMRNPLRRYVLATRPQFLSVTLFACVIGIGSAHASGKAIAWDTALATIVSALLAHAGVNVLNDYYDALNGSDALNTERVFPFTGGSRFIQNGVLSTAATARFGVALFILVVFAGVWLISRSGPGLLIIGMAGLIIGWAYSAPPAMLNNRGLGEPAVTVGFALIVVGSDYVQRHAFTLAPLIAAGSYALLVTNILYLNQFPDRAADAAAGKRHWVVRLAPRWARWGYVVIAVAAYAWQIGAVLAGLLPALTLLALLAALPSALAARELLRYAGQPQTLAPTIRKTIAAAALHAVLLAGALFSLG